MSVRNVYHQYKKVVHLGVSPGLPFEESQRTLLYNVVALYGILIHSVFLVVNLVFKNYWLLIFSIAQVAIALLILLINTKRQGLNARQWLVILSTLTMFFGTFFLKNGNEYILLTYLIAAVIIFDKVWKYLLYAGVVIIFFSVLIVKSDVELASLTSDSIRGYINMIVALVLLTVSVHYFKLYYNSLIKKLESAREETRKSARLYEFLSAANDLILHANSENEIYTEICKLAIDTGGFTFALIASPDKATKIFKPYTWAGFEDGYLQVYDKYTNNTGSTAGDSPSWKVVEEGNYYYSNDIANDPIAAVWAHEALKRGYRAFINLPVKKQGAVSSLLILYSYKVNFFTDNELAMLVRVVENIELAISAFHSEKKRRDTEIQLNKVTQAVEQSAASIVITDVAGNIEYVNPAFTRVTGYSFDEAVGRNPNMLKTGYTSEGEYRSLWDKLMQKEGWQGVFKNKKKNGDTYWENASISPIVNGEGEITSFVAVKEDITEQKNAELAFKERNIFIETALENLPIGIAINKINDGTVTLMNKQFSEIYGWPEELLTDIDSFIDHVYPDKEASAATIARIMEDIASGDPTRMNWEDITITTQHNGKRIVNAKNIPIYGQGLMISTVVDVTEKKHAELQLKELNTQLSTRAKELATSNTELEQFAYVASHDLQEPLRMVTSFLTLLELHYAASLDEKALQYINFAVDGSKRMKKVILDLLEFSRVGRHFGEMEQFDVNEVVNEALLLNQKEVVASGAAIKTNPLPIVHSYKIPLGHVFQNLVANALKYRSEGIAPQIEINCAALPEHWRFSVKDNGIGIEPEYFEKIFVIFQRLHNQKQYSGTGIGLAICKKIIESLGGNIWVESEKIKGACFYFTIPRT